MYSGKNDIELYIELAILNSQEIKSDFTSKMLNLMWVLAATELEKSPSGGWCYSPCVPPTSGYIMANLHAFCHAISIS